MLEPIEEVTVTQRILKDTDLDTIAQLVYSGNKLDSVLSNYQIAETDLKSALSQYFFKLSRQSGDALTGGTRKDGTDYSPRAAGLSDVLTAPHTIRELCTEILRLKRIIRVSNTPLAA